MTLAALVCVTALAIGSLAAVPIAAAQSRAAGVVMRFGAVDSQPVAGVRVVLHRVGRERQGPIDSTLTDRVGRFRFLFPSDTGALYLLTARYAGVQYFSEPVATNPSRADTGMVISVYDTSSTQPITLEARHIVVSAPEEDGSRSVVELVSISNRGSRARVGVDGTPVWGMELPRGAFGFAAGEGDLTAGAVDRRGDSVVVVAPIAPGERQLAVEYRLPPGIPGLSLGFAEAVPLVNVLLEEREGNVNVASLEPADSVAVIQGREFRRWSGSMGPGAALRISFPVRSAPGRTALALLVGAVLVGLMGASVVAFRRPRRERVALTPGPDGLIDALAELDRRYAGRQDTVPESEWQEYQKRRADLKQTLSDALAERRGAT